MISRIRLFLLPLLLLALIGAACSKSPAPGDSSSDGKSGARPAIVFMTDFGAANDAVAICKAVMLGIWPGGGIIGSILVAFVGAVILVWIARKLKKA